MRAQFRKNKRKTVRGNVKMSYSTKPNDNVSTTVGHLDHV